MAERINNTIETQINEGNTLITQMAENGQVLQSVIQDVPQVQTVLQNGINVSSQINAPFVEVTSVNGKTGDVITEPIVGEFEANHYYLKNTMISYNDTLYYAKANFTSGNSFNASDWYAVEGTQITVDSAFSTTSENPVQNKVITDKINEMERFKRSLKAGTRIPVNSDLKSVDYLRVGSYYCPSNNDVATLTNCPTTDAFMLEVISPLSNTDIDAETTTTWCQRLRILTTYKGVVWYQQCTSGSTPQNWTYSAWYKTANTGDINNSVNGAVNTKVGTAQVQTYTSTGGQYVKLAEISHGNTSNDNIICNFKLDVTTAGANGYLKTFYFGVGTRMGNTSLSSAKFEYLGCQDFGATQFDFDFKRDVKVTYKYTAGSSGVAHNLKMQIWIKMSAPWRKHWLWPLQSSYKNDYGNSRQNTNSTDEWTYYSVSGNSATIGQATYLETGFTELNCKDVVGVPYLNSYSSRPTTANTTPDGKGGLRTFLASSSMTTGKPGSVDGHIIQLDWDGTNGYDSQIYLENGNNGNLYIRGQSAGTWGNWKQIAQTADLPSAATTSSLGTVQIGDGLDITNAGVISTKLQFTDETSAEDVNWELFINKLYPVGSIYLSTSLDTVAKVQEAFGGTWEAWGSGRVPVGVDTTQTEFNTVNKTGGSKYLQEHSHNTVNWASGYQTGSQSNFFTVLGGDSTTNTRQAVATAGTGDSGNLQPYITCYMYRRIS